MQILIKIAELGINLTIEMTDQVLNKLRVFWSWIRKHINKILNSSLQPIYLHKPNQNANQHHCRI